MNIQEKNAEFIIEALADKVRSLEADNWYLAERIKVLEAENNALKGGGTVGKA